MLEELFRKAVQLGQRMLLRTTHSSGELLDRVKELDRVRSQARRW
jgi:hypothetical protein